MRVVGGRKSRPYLRQDGKVFLARAFQSCFVIIVSKSMTTSGLREQNNTSKQPQQIRRVLAKEVIQGKWHLAIY